MFDFSNYPKDSKFFDQANKKIIRNMKDKSDWLKSKMYSMENVNGKESNTAKGVSIATNFNEFKDTMFNKKKASNTKWEEFKAKSIK